MIEDNGFSLAQVALIVTIIAVGGGIIGAVFRLIFDMGKRRQTIDTAFKDLKKGLAANTKATNGNGRALRGVRTELKNHVAEHARMEVRP